MMRRITRRIDDQQVGTIAAEDGCDYMLRSMALSQRTFRDLSLGAAVTFEPITSPKGMLRAAAVSTPGAVKTLAAVLTQMTHTHSDMESAAAATGATARSSLGTRPS